MSWFGKKATPMDDDENDPPPPPRTASDEYVEGLKFVLGVYVGRAESARKIVKERALSVANATNYERVGNDLGAAETAHERASRFEGIAEEIREWIDDFEKRGYRPPHLPPLPPEPTKPYQGGE